MSKRTAIGNRPGADPRIDGWLRSRGDGHSSTPPVVKEYTARLTVDMTPELRGRIKVAAFQRGETVAAMLRQLLETSFPERTNPP